MQPNRIVAVATGYMAAKQLFSASRAGLFDALAAGPATAGELAERTGLPERTVRILADSMTGLGLLDRAEGVYANAPDAQCYLTGGGLAPYLAFLDAISYPHWEAFDETVRSSMPAPLDLGADRMSTFLTGVMTYNALHARMLAQTYDFVRHSRALDLGGLSASFLAEARRVAPELLCVFLSGEPLASSARETFGEAEVITGDVLECEVPTGFDLVLLEHVVHRYDPAQNRLILAKARAAATSGARLLLLDFFLDEDPRQRTLDALHAAEYLVIDGTTVHPAREVRAWMTAAGWEPVEVLDLPGSPRVIVAEAR